jgi:CRP-like cAMP-binding protein
VSNTPNIRRGGIEEILQRSAIVAAINNWDQIVNRAGIERGAELGVVSALAKQLQPSEFEAGEKIFVEGEPGDRVFIIGRGKVKVSAEGPGGRVNLLAVLGTSDVLGELGVFDPGPRTCTATAVTGVEAVWLDRATLRALMADRPTIAEQLLQVLARRLQHADSELIELMSSSDVPGRVARQLLLLARRFGTQEGEMLRVVHELTEAEMAQLVGADCVSVNNALQDFVSRGWVLVENNSVLVIDRDALARRTNIRSSAYARSAMSPLPDWSMNSSRPPMSAPYPESQLTTGAWIHCDS